MGLVQSTVTNDSGRVPDREAAPRNVHADRGHPGLQDDDPGRARALDRRPRVKVNFNLEIGKLEENITVIGVSPLVETTRAQVSTVITEKEFLSYPQGNRDYTSLIAYAPGTLPGAGRSGYAVNGMRGSSNNFQIDGIDNNDNGTATNAVTSMPPESIQEFRLVSNNFSAEYGRNSGGVINAVMKSGTNEFHGSAWIFHRGGSALFQSEDWLTHDLPPYKRYQYGATVGGPIIKDKTFFFASFEGVIQDDEARTPQTVLHAGSHRAGPGPAKTYFDKYGSTYPKPTYDFVDIDGDGLVDAGKYVWDGTTKTRGYNFGLKIDHIFSEKDRIAVRWLFNTYNYEWDFAAASRYRQEESLFLSHRRLDLAAPLQPDHVQRSPDRLSPGLRGLAAARPRGSVDRRLFLRRRRDRHRRLPEHAAEVRQQYLSAGGRPELPGRQPQHQARRRGQALEFGLDVRRQRRGELTISSIRRGSSMTSAPITLSSGLTRPIRPRATPTSPAPPAANGRPGDSHRKWQGFEGGLFVQDDWRVTDKLTVSLGLRWEYYGVPKEKSGVGINMPAFGTKAGFDANPKQIIEGKFGEEGIKYLIFDGRQQLGKGLWNPYYKAFAPKVSFAYDLTGDGKTSLRAGAGISYDRTFNNTYENDRFNYPDFTFASMGGGYGYGTPYINVTYPGTVPAANIQGYRAALRWMLPDLLPQKAYNWLVGVQRELSTNVSIELNYTGSKGMNLGSIQRPNRFTGDRLDGIADGINAYTAIRDLNLRTQNLKSDYSAFTATINKRFANGWSWYTAYTYGIAKDQNSDYFGRRHAERHRHGSRLQRTDRRRVRLRPVRPSAQGRRRHDLRHALL